MKQIFALLFGILLVTGLRAQMPDSISNSPYRCYYIDENSFQCDKGPERNPEVVPLLKENKSSMPEREKKFNPDQEEVDRNKSSKKIQQKYGQPEKESDSGILNSDLDGVEIDSSTIIKKAEVNPNRKPKQIIRNNTLGSPEASGKPPKSKMDK